MIPPPKVLQFFCISQNNVEILHNGENLSWKAHKNNFYFVIKKLRNDRPSTFSVRGEIAWLEALSKELPCVKVLNDQSTVDAEGHVYLAYEFLGGTEPDKLTILKNCKEVLDENFPKDRQFIHGDFHLGNLIQLPSTSQVSSEVQTPPQFKIIDFDECGFGPVSYELGTMKMHTMTQPEKWKMFLKGYGFTGSQDELKFGVASRIFYMIGKIPKRLDVAGLAKKAPDIMGKYAEWLKKTLEE